MKKNNKVMILGASGMLGSMLANWLIRDISLDLSLTVRSEYLKAFLENSFPQARIFLLEADRCSSSYLYEILKDFDWVINAIGLIKPYIDSPCKVEEAIKINALFPYTLMRIAEKTGCRILQIATDCVYSGYKGNYIELDKHDAFDIYGKTKSLGEVKSSQFINLRCSIIGPESKNHVSLFDWLLKQNKNAIVDGYINHRWNGITTLQFAKICQGIIRQNLDIPTPHHLIPEDSVSKAELLSYILNAWQRTDITIRPTNSETSIDRTLDTINPTLNQQLWAAAGYTDLPTIVEMVSELAQFDGCFEVRTNENNDYFRNPS